MTKVAFARKLMTMLTFLEDLKKILKNIKYWVVLTKSLLLRFKATFGPKICTEDVKRSEFKVTKFERFGSFYSDVTDKKGKKRRNPPLGSIRVKIQVY